MHDVPAMLCHRYILLVRLSFLFSVPGHIRLVRYYLSLVLVVYFNAFNSNAGYLVDEHMVKFFGVTVVKHWTERFVSSFFGQFVRLPVRSCLNCRIVIFYSYRSVFSARF